MSNYHDAVVFIDRREAKVFHLSANHEVGQRIVHTSAARRHHRADHEDATEHAVDDSFMKCIVGSLDHSGDTLILGPGNSKYELEKYLQQHRPDLIAHLAAVQNADDPTEGGILGAARTFFGTRNHRQRRGPPRYAASDGRDSPFQVSPSMTERTPAAFHTDRTARSRCVELLTRPDSST